MFLLPLEVKTESLDPDYKHLHHAEIIKLLERARLGFLEEIGMPNESFHKDELFIVIANIFTSFKREIAAGEYFVTVENVRDEGKALLMTQRLFNSKKKCCVEAEIDLRFLDGNKKRAVEIPALLLETIDGLRDEEASEGRASLLKKILY